MLANRVGLRIVQGVCIGNLREAIATVAPGFALQFYFYVSG